jgi:hypothetical protein
MQIFRDTMAVVQEKVLPAVEEEVQSSRHLTLSDQVGTSTAVIVSIQLR